MKSLVVGLSMRVATRASGSSATRASVKDFRQVGMTWHHLNSCWNCLYSGELDSRTRLIILLDFLNCIISLVDNKTPALRAGCIRSNR